MVDHAFDPVTISNPTSEGVWSRLISPRALQHRTRDSTLRFPREFVTRFVNDGILTFDLDFEALWVWMIVFDGYPSELGMRGGASSDQV
ncbi:MULTISPECIES: hypothetical protein [unclassified Halobacterium]|uniref:hypothetical protein n=1 Tax=unclassified Halobacterium TaxID=2668073 RepID=UPI001E2AB5B8|nr:MULTISPECIES: hypothetical protein [unclassified Halobacterium]MCD2198982.1 hypothetical protein [Halobacterium sp. KA-4]MCD2203000.1 hypothetical protein [Halobacterium sp. KA-6]